MKLTFLGTRGNIEASSSRHGMHSSLLVEYLGRSVMPDCGETWLGKPGNISPGAVVLVHGHSDHAFGLKEGAPCPVYATGYTWAEREICSFPIRDRRTIGHRSTRDIEGTLLEAFPVAHSTRASAVGYRISAGRVTMLYVPDVVFIEDLNSALSGVRLYIGDGASISRSMVRKPGDSLVGHARSGPSLPGAAGKVCRR